MEEILQNISLIYKRQEYIDKILDDLQGPTLKINGVTLVGVVFDENMKPNYTDTEKYINNENVLIIYNENFGQFLDKTDCLEGSGNGKLRKYRTDGDCTKTKAAVFGIPTGTFNGDTLDTIKWNGKTYRQIINDAIKQITDYLQTHNQIKYVIWSINKEGMLGLAEFAKIQEVQKAAKYISNKIKSIFPNKAFYPQAANVKNHGNYFDLSNLLLKPTPSTIQKPATSIIEYGLYLVPDTETGTGTCSSKGINWKGKHITIAGFSKDNESKIRNVLNTLPPPQGKRWNPDPKPDKTKQIPPNKWKINSGTLKGFTQNIDGQVDNLRLDNWHMYCDEGVPQNPSAIKQSWSLIMVKKDGNNVTWLNDTKKPFYDSYGLPKPIAKPIAKPVAAPVVKPVAKPAAAPVVKPVAQQKIRVLSYNISWEAMTGEWCSGENPTKCLKNIAKFIQDKGPYDFVGLQEASEWNEIKKRSTYLQNMNHVHLRFSEEQITFYDKKYILDDGIQIIKSYFGTPGRPITILFFQGNLCVINVHAGHGKTKNDKNKNEYTFMKSDCGDTPISDSIYNLEKLLNMALNNFMYYKQSGTTCTYSGRSEFIYKNNDIKKKLDQIKRDEITTKLKTYDIILIGDMNNPLNTIPKFWTREFYGKTTEVTCCTNSNLIQTGHDKVADHILYTKPNKHMTKVYRPGDYHSDHLPVIAEITR